MVQIGFFGAEESMNTNLQTGPFVGGGTKRKRDKVIQIKIENWFSNTQRISVLTGCFSLYTLNPYILTATLKQDLYRKMPSPILQPPWILQTNKKVVLSDILTHLKKALALHTLLSNLLEKIQQFWGCSAFHPSVYCQLEKALLSNVPWIWPDLRSGIGGNLSCEWHSIQCRLIYPATLLLHFFPRGQGGIISSLIKFTQPSRRSVPHRFCLFQGFLNVHCELHDKPYACF